MNVREIHLPVKQADGKWHVAFQREGTPGLTVQEFESEAKAMAYYRLLQADQDPEQFEALWADGKL